MVECNLAKVDVEGSNPFSRSLFIYFRGPNPENVRFEKLSDFICWPRKPGQRLGQSPVPRLAFLLVDCPEGTTSTLLSTTVSTT